MENEKILLISYGILYSSQEKGFLIATWYYKSKILGVVNEKNLVSG